MTVVHGDGKLAALTVSDQDHLCKDEATLKIKTGPRMPQYLPADTDGRAITTP